MMQSWFGVLAAAMSCGMATAQDAPRPYAALVCLSEANGPWTEKARGNTTVSGPGFLMERFGAAPKAAEPAERRQSVEATGEIRESAGANRLALLIGSKCPQAKPPRRM